MLLVYYMMYGVDSQASIDALGLPVKSITNAERIQHEVVRKTIHMLIAFVPFLAAYDVMATMVLLGMGIVFYTFAETMRLNGRRIILVTDITLFAIRDRDRGKLVLGPITLGIGAMLSLLLYPEPASSIAIFALAFGDGFASLVGSLFGKKKIPFTGGKSYIGTFAGFLAVFIITFKITGNLLFSLIISTATSLFELFPTKDIDNLIIPVGTGLVAMKFFYLL